MAQAKSSAPVPIEARREMLRLHEEGYSIREIAQEVGWANSTVSRYLRMAGADTDRSRTAEATAARVRKIQERKVDLAEELMDDSFSWRHRIWSEYTHVVNSSEGPTTVDLDEPPLSEQASGAKALDITINTVDRLLEGIGDSGVDDAKNVLGNLLEGLASLVSADDGLSDGDQDGDYDIMLDPDQKPVDMSDSGDEDE